MSEFEFDLSGGVDAGEITANGFGMLRKKDDGALFVQFYDREKYMSFLTEEARKVDPKAPPVFQKVTHCRIRPPGRLFEHDQPVRECDKARFPREWQLYLNGNKAIQGDSLDELKTIADDQKSFLEFMGIRSIQQLAAATDSQVMELGVGAKELKDRAVAYLDKRRAAAIRAANEEQKRETESLKQLVAAQQKAIEELQAKLTEKPAKTTISK